VRRMGPTSCGQTLIVRIDYVQNEAYGKWDAFWVVPFGQINAAKAPQGGLHAGARDLSVGADATAEHLPAARSWRKASVAGYYLADAKRNGPFVGTARAGSPPTPPRPLPGD
jgi:hypothetical protein